VFAEMGATATWLVWNVGWGNLDSNAWALTGDRSKSRCITFEHMKWKEGDRPVPKSFVTESSQFAVNYSPEQSMTPGNHFLQIDPDYFGQPLWTR